MGYSRTPGCVRTGGVTSEERTSPREARTSPRVWGAELIAPEVVSVPIRGVRGTVTGDRDNTRETTQKTTRGFYFDRPRSVRRRLSRRSEDSTLPAGFGTCGDAATARERDSGKNENSAKLFAFLVVFFTMPASWKTRRDNFYSY